jgi:hypothetical protein
VQAAMFAQAHQRQPIGKLPPRGHGVSVFLIERDGGDVLLGSRDRQELSRARAPLDGQEQLAGDAAAKGRGMDDYATDVDALRTRRVRENAQELASFPPPQKGIRLVLDVGRRDTQGREIRVVDQVALHGVGGLLELVDRRDDPRIAVIDAGDHGRFSSW